MRRVEPYDLWLGNAGDLRSPSNLLNEGIRAVVDLAGNEPFPQLPRDLTYCRFPLLDGDGNDPVWLQMAVRTLADLMNAGVPTIVCCSNGLSRSPAIAAATLSVLGQLSFDDALIRITTDGKHDVSPALWNEIRMVFRTSAGA